MVSPLIRLCSRRSLVRHPWQLGLTVLGVTLGVAMVVAVDLANRSAERAFALSREGISGRATHQILGGPRGLDENLYTRLRIELGLRQSAPVVEGYGRVNGETVQLVGVDPLAEAPFRGRLQAVTDLPVERLLTEAGTVLMSARTAGRLGIAVDGRFRFLAGGREYSLTLIGLIPEDRLRPAARDGVLITDIATAQETLHLTGRLSWVDLVLPPGAAGEVRLQHLRQWLPPGTEIVPAAARTHAMARMSTAFHINLSAMGLLALVVGMFLIFNSVSFSVVRRRQLLGTLRVLGLTRAELFRMILREAVLVGALGTVLGLLAGLALGQGLVHLVTRTINDLYYVLTVRQMLLGPAPFIKGALLGLGATVLSALGPAWEASRTAPRSGLQRSQLEQRSHAAAPRLAWLGIILISLALLGLWLSGEGLVPGFITLFLLIIGMTLVSPQLVALISRHGAARLRGRRHIQARLALRGVEASLSRTGVAVAALMLAVAATVGVGIMIASFRSTVALWLEATLRSDIYITVPGAAGAAARPELDPAILEQVRALPGVAAVASGRSLRVESREGLTEVFALDRPAAYPPRYPLKQGRPGTVWPRFQRGEGVLVSEALAFRRQLGPGDHVELRTDRGRRRFPIIGVYYDYGSGPGTVLMARRLYQRYWQDRGIDSLGVQLAQGAEREQVMDMIRKQVKSEQALVVRSAGDIRRDSLEIFDRTFTITRVLRLLAVGVAFIGILNALIALQLERARELGVLRALGLTPGQLRGLVLAQTGFMGALVGLLALPVGTVLALVLIHVINRRAFGWSMQTLLPAEIYLQSVVLAVAAALAAGLYPAWKMGRLRTAAALREE